MNGDAKDLVLDIYDTVVDQSRWPGVLDRIADTINARGCIVFELRGHGAEREIAAPLHSGIYSRRLLDHYITAYRLLELEDQDTFEAHSLATDGIDLISDAVLHCANGAAQRPHERLLKTYGIHHRAAGLLDKDNKYRARFSIQLGEEHGPMTAGDRHVLGQVLPHVAKAMDLGRPAARLAAEHRSLVAAMDHLRIGVCILDRECRVALANEEFQRQREAYGAFRTDSGGHLQLTDSANQRRFLSLFDDVLSHGAFGARPRKEAIVMAVQGNRGALCVEVAPLDTADDMSDANWGGAIVYSLDSSQPTETDTTVLQEVFGLTPTEAMLSSLVGEGLTNNQIADRRCRSVETVNAQIKSLLTKTQCANRTQLVRLLSGFSADYLRRDA